MILLKTEKTIHVEAYTKKLGIFTEIEMIYRIEEYKKRQEIIPAGSIKILRRSNV